MKGPDVKPEYLNGLSDLSPYSMVSTLREQGPNLLVFVCLMQSKILGTKWVLTLLTRVSESLISRRFHSSRGQM